MYYSRLKWDEPHTSRLTTSTEQVMTLKQKVVFMCCDGLSRHWISDELTPSLAQLARDHVWCGNHQAVFPSVTRVSAATIATGCMPHRHGLHGNRMGLLEEGRVVVRDVGAPDFRDHMRRATGGTLKVPTLAERVAHLDGFVGFSNVSPGAAYFLDPEHHGFIYHRAGSFGPGGKRLDDPQHLRVSHDIAGDFEMVARFCKEILTEKKPTVSVLWIANPDLTLHGASLGGPQHREALRCADQQVRTVVECIRTLREQGEDILLLIGSDHGQETIGGSVNVDEFLATRGLGPELSTGSIAVASQGTSALIYATDDAREKAREVIRALADLPWVDSIRHGESLASLGMPADEHLVAAINMGFISDTNAYGVSGQRWIAAEPGKSPKLGDGQHGGWGAEETSPFLVLNHPDLGADALSVDTHLVDIAPTALAFLGLPTEGVDGRPLIENEPGSALRLASHPVPGTATPNAL